MIQILRTKNQLTELTKVASTFLDQKMQLSVAQEERMETLFVHSNVCCVVGLMTMRKEATLFKQEATFIPSEQLAYNQSGKFNDLAHCFGFKKPVLDHLAIQANLMALRAANCHSVYLDSNGQGGFVEGKAFDSIPLAVGISQRTKEARLDSIFRSAIIADEVKKSLMSCLDINCRTDRILAQALSSLIAYGVSCGFSAEEIETGTSLFLNNFFPINNQLSYSCDSQSSLAVEECLAVGRAIHCLKRVKLGYQAEGDVFRSVDSQFRRFHNYPSSASYFDLSFPQNIAHCSFDKLHLKFGCYPLEISSALHGFLKLLQRALKSENFGVQQLKKISFAFPKSAQNNPCFAAIDSNLTYDKATLSAPFSLSVFVNKVLNNVEFLDNEHDVQWEHFAPSPYDYDSALANPSLISKTNPLIDVSFDDSEVNRFDAQQLPAKIKVHGDGFEFDSGVVSCPPESPLHKSSVGKSLLKAMFNCMAVGKTDQKVRAESYLSKITTLVGEKVFDSGQITRVYFAYRPA